MALFKKNKEEALSLVYANLKGVNNCNISVKVKLNDETECLEFIDNNLVKFKIKYLDINTVNRYFEKVLPPTYLGKNAKSEIIFITKINYIEHGELKSLTMEDPALSLPNKREKFAKEIIDRIPVKKTKINNEINNSIEALKGLKELLDIGAITEEEFNIKKKELLNI